MQRVPAQLTTLTVFCAVDGLRERLTPRSVDPAKGLPGLDGVPADPGDDAADQSPDTVRLCPPRP